MASQAGLLSGARRRLTRGWTQQADARALDGRPVFPDDDRAVSWSLIGSLVAEFDPVARAHGKATAIEILALGCVLLADILDTDSLEAWNDEPGRTQAQVIGAIDRAIAVAAPLMNPNRARQLR
jgi:hypothetical protein